MHVTVVFGTTEGHTGKICRRLAEWSRALGHTVDVVDTGNAPDDLVLSASDVFVVAGSIHMERHQGSLISFVRNRVDELSSKPSLFLSVSLTAVNEDEESQSEALRCIEAFYHQSHWHPTEAHPVAGALLYTHYDFFRRMVLKAIAKREGGPTDVTQDYEFTDWELLRSQFETFLARNAIREATELPA